MNINRHNCEAWFLDYYEGQLTPDQSAELFAFLDAHPDLKELFESYEGPAFDAGDVELPSFEQKETLRRMAELEAGINEVNYEEYFTAAVENVLDIKGQADLARFLSAHPEKREELERYRKTILSPDYAETFGNKDLLKKPAVTAASFDTWAAAALDGVLSNEEKIAFNSFLQENPAYKAEFALFEKAVLEPDTTIVFEAKDKLRKTLSEITAANFADYAVAALEGQLNAEEQHTFNSFVAQHPAFAAELELFRNTILAPETDIVFEHKATLKKSVAEINADNFAEFAVAALDGELNSFELAAFNTFIAANPVFAAEFETYRKTIVAPDATVVFEGKLALKKAVAEVNADNFAEYAVAVIDGEVNGLELTAFNAFVAENPGYAGDLEAYRKTVLTADLSETYPNPEDLKRKTGGIVWLGSNVRYAAAAAVLLFVVTFWWTRGNETANNGQFVANNSAWHRDKGTDTTPGNIQPDNIAERPSTNNETENPGNKQPRNYTPAPNQNQGNGNRALFASIRPRNINRIRTNTPNPGYVTPNITVLPDYANSVAKAPISVDEPGIAWEEEKQKISLGQYIMRETKELLDEPAPAADDYALGFNAKQPVTGKELAGSAFNRATSALGLNLRINRSRLDGTSLEIGKYNLQLSQGDKIAE
jgi:anti-sigma factor RsiW